MLAVVEVPRTRNTKEVSFKVEGYAIPDWFVSLIKNAFPSAVIKGDVPRDDSWEEGDDELVNVFETDWYKEMEAESTPGKSLKIMRNAARLTQDQLSKKTGIPKQNISAMERDMRPISLRSAQKFAKAIGTSYTMFYKDKK